MSGEERVYCGARTEQFVVVGQLLNTSTKWLNEAMFWNRSYVNLAL